MYLHLTSNAELQSYQADSSWDKIHLSLVPYVAGPLFKMEGEKCG